ncbi:hypothetical protein [Thiomonas sp. FB-6]|uniref:hypothetical protein n=1 Tax=Thiomonas sp. FB-6 TaxID=1158291 RepID=UPI0012DF1D1A|nr:hypothetical protein [Thiomonas sp. FB-6]
MLEAPAPTPSATTEDAAIHLIVDAMAINRVTLPMLASALGYESTQIVGRLRRTEKFEDAFLDPDTREVCRLGGPWKVWVGRRLKRGLRFSDLVIDKAKLPFLLQAFCESNGEQARPKT